MAEIHGSEARLYLNGTDVSGSFTGSKAKTTREKIRSTGYGDAGETHVLAPQSDGMITADGMLDMVASPSVASWDAVKTANATLDGTDLLVLMARDTTLGDPGLAVYGSLPAIETSHPMTDLAKLSLEAAGSLGAQIVAALQPKGAATGAGNGSTLDNAAATANGGNSYLQVFALTGTAPVISIKAQHSVDGSVWADLATHAAINGAGVTAGYRDVQQIAAGTTVRQYMRWLLAITSGSLTSITFAHQFARN
jgi:hypothetical protein